MDADTITLRAYFFLKKALINNILMHETDGQQHH